METRQSRMLCARVGLLLLIGAILTHLPQAHTRPTDFWCNSKARNRIMNMAEKKVNSSCALPSAVPVPCEGINLAEWKNKTLAQKRAEVLQALQVLQEGVQRIRNRTSAECVTSSEALEHSITQYVAIVRERHVQDENSTSFQTQTQICGNTTSLGDVLESYRKLVNGRLMLLASDLKPCHLPSMAANGS